MLNVYPYYRNSNFPLKLSQQWATVCYSIALEQGIFSKFFNNVRLASTAITDAVEV